MSGLLDALRRGRFRRNGNGDSLEAGLGKFAIDISEIQPIRSDAGKKEVGVPVDVLAQQSESVSLPPTAAKSDDTLTGIPTKTMIVRNARLIPHAIDPVVVEHYRRLRTKIVQHQTEKPFRSLVLTSAFPQEGKTVTALNLALSFAMLPSYRVLVVDGDLRKGTLGNWLGMNDTRPGLSNVLDGSTTLDQVILKSDEAPLYFMMRGGSRVPPAELLHSPELGSTFQKLSEQFDLVLVDSPPVNLITDVQLLAGSCDAVLLIARAFATKRKAFERAVQDLLPFRVIGSVLNAGTDGPPRRYKGYY
jgi:capsular exopolysaccharide synthesis family protein